jgi:hypothetical protein
MMMDVDEFRRIFKEVHGALHRCWTKAVGTKDYVKADWRTLDNALSRFARDAATLAGIPREERLL